MKKADIKEETTEQLKEDLEQAQSTYVDMKMNHIVSSLENPQVIPEERKKIARIKTELRKREIEATK